MTVPDADTREEIADQIREHPAAEIVDFTRDLYKTMVVRVRSDGAAAELTAIGVDAGYDVNRGPDGQELVFEARERASEKVRWEVTGYDTTPSDRIGSNPAGNKKPASRQAENETSEGDGDDEGSNPTTSESGSDE